MSDTTNGTTGLLPTYRFKRPLVLALVAGLTLSGCTTTGGKSGAPGSANTAASDDYCNPNNPKLTPAERQMCEDAATTFNETVAGGALTGALAGAAVGALAGLLTGNGKAVARGAVIGAAAGGIMGGVDGYITAKAQETGNNQVMMLNSMANDVDEQNAKLRKLVSSSSKVLSDSQKRIAKLDADQRAGRASLEQVQEERQRIEGHRDRLAAWLGKAKEQRDQYVQASAKMRQEGNSTAEIDAKIKGMNTQIAELEKNVAGLNTATQIRRA